MLNVDFRPYYSNRRFEYLIGIPRGSGSDVSHIKCKRLISAVRQFKIEKSKLEILRRPHIYLPTLCNGNNSEGLASQNASSYSYSQTLNSLSKNSKSLIGTLSCNCGPI